MYISSFNKIDDRKRIIEFIKAHGFATIISDGEKGMVASHLPVLWDEGGGEWGTLRSHMARANPQWRHLSEKEILCVFHGPHAYISPSWYVMQHTVPTWNYAVVHLYGIATLVDETSLRQIVYDTTEKYESGRRHPWRIPLGEDELQKQLKAIVGFSIQITRVEAKFKLGQNRSIEDQDSMLRALQNADDSASRELGDFIAAQRSNKAPE